MAVECTEMSRLNQVDEAAFVDALSGVFENAPWVAEGVVSRRPFLSADDLHREMMAMVYQRPLNARMDFLCGHPELAGKAARTGAMTDASVAEQSGMGLDRLSREQLLRFERGNADYRARFGFPFIVCVRNYTCSQILDLFESRLRNEQEVEVARALAEVADITRFRLEDALHRAS